MALVGKPKVIIQTGKNIDSKIRNGAQRLVTEILEAHGFSGEWRLRPIKLVGKNCEPFDPKAVVTDPSSKQPRIKALIRPQGNESSWEYQITPPKGVDIQSALRKLQTNGVARHIPPTKSKEELDSSAAGVTSTAGTDTGTIEVPEGYMNTLVGKVVNGIVDGAADFGVFIDLGDGMAGLCPTRFLRKQNPNAYARGDEVDVRVQNVEPDRNKSGKWRISLSEIDAKVTHKPGIDGFVPIVDRQNKMSVAGFVECHERTVFALDSVAEQIADNRDVAIPCKAFAEAVTMQICAYYSCDSITAVGPIMKKLKGIGLIDAIDIPDGEAYIITKSGWTEIDAFNEVNSVDSKTPQKIAKQSPLGAVTPTVPVSTPQKSSQTPALENPVAALASLRDQLAAATEYREKKARLDDLNKQLAKFQPILDERDELADWIAQHEHVAEASNNLENDLDDIEEMIRTLRKA